MNALRWLLPIIATNRRAFAGTLVSNLLHQLCVLALGLVSALLLGQALFAGSWSGDQRLLIGVIAGLALAASAAAWWEMYVSHDLAYSLLATLRSRAFGALARSVPNRRLGRSSADDSTAVMSDVELLEWLFAHTVAQVLTSVLVLASGGVLSLLISPMLILVWAPAAILVAIIPWAMGRWGIRDGERVRTAGVRLHSLLVETVQGMGDLMAAGAVPARLRRVRAADTDHARAQLRSAARSGLEGALGDIVVTGAGVVTIVITALLIRGGQVAPSLIAVAMVLATATLGPAAQIAGLLKNIGALVASARRVKAVLTEPPAAPEPADPVLLDPAAVRRLEFDDVWFGYDAAQPVLRGITFHVDVGEVVALVGPSGAGKSTCAALALRLWDPDAGGVRIDGSPLDRIADPTLRRAITAVPQDTHLLRGTIEGNLRLVDPDASAEDVLAAARSAGILEPRAGLSRGVATPVGERGGGLSGGQRARVAMARAQLSGAPILVLDEAIAHLDAISERDISRAITENAQNRATLVIAHRATTIKTCDRVIVLDRGAVVEQGTPAELLADQSSRLSDLLSRDREPEAEPSW